MDRKNVYFTLSDFLNQAAYDCLRLGHKFLLFNGEIYLVSKRCGLVDELDDTSTMKVLEKITINRTGIFEKDLFGDKWAQQSKEETT